MNNRIVIKLGALLVTGALATGGSLGAAQAATSSSDETSTTRQAGPRGGGPDLSALASKLGVTTAKLQAALATARPAAAERPARSDRAADLAAALDVDAAKIQAILDANRPARPAPGIKPAAPDQSALVTALADGLSLDKTTVQAALTKLDAAHQAEHQARDTAMAAAIAKELGLSTEKVTAALEATRPARPKAAA
jgi:HD-GYP domain-containing protein (c-di-GMP phosphodiesterase class II)